jgi:hypothetical protein
MIQSTYAEAYYLDRKHPASCYDDIDFSTNLGKFQHDYQPAYFHGWLVDGAV